MTRHNSLFQATAVTRQLAVIDTTLEDWDTLRAALPPDMPTVLLPANEDGLTHLAQAVQAHRDLTAIHLLSHGSEGALHLGTACLDSEALTQRAQTLADIGTSFAAGSDILVYGCHVAAGDGAEFLTALAEATGSQVAASRTATGAADRGGDWDLDWRHGNVQTPPLRVEAYRGVMAPPEAPTEPNVYIGESIIVLEFDGLLDESSQPLLSRFHAQSPGDMSQGTSAILVNGMTMNITSAVVSGRTVTLSVAPHSFTAGDYIEFRYLDPAGDDANGVIQSTSGQDVLSAHYVSVVSISRPLSAPTVTATGNNGTYVQGDTGPGLDLFSSVTAQTNDAGQVFHGLTLTVTGLSGTDDESLSGASFGSLGLTQGIKSVGPGGALTAIVNMTPVGQTFTATITIGGMSHTDSELSALIDGLRYRNDSTTVTPGDRVISITGVSDSGGSNNQSALTGVSTTVTVSTTAPELTAPDVSLTPEDSYFQIGSGAATAGLDLFDGVTAATLDAGQTFSGMVLTVHHVRDAANEFISIGGTDISLAAGSGSFSQGSYAVTVNGDVTTVTLSGMALNDSAMSDLIDDMHYKNTSPTFVSPPSSSGFFAVSDARSIILRSVTDSGATDNVTNVNAVSTVNPGVYGAQSNTITAVSPGGTIPPGETTTLSFDITVSAAMVLVGSSLYFDVNAPTGWIITNMSGAVMTGLVSQGTYVLTFDVTPAGTDTDGVFPLSLHTSWNGLSAPQANVISSSALVTLAHPAPEFQSAAVDGTELVLTYDAELDASAPPLASAFAVTVNGSAVAVTSVDIDAQAGTVTLTLASAVQPDEVVLVSYTDPSAGNDAAAIQTPDGADAASLVNQAVTNNSSDTLAPVITSVSIPNALMQVGDVVTAVITVSADADDYTLGTSTINGFALSNLVKVDNTTYTVEFTVAAGGTAVAAGDDVAVSIVLVDSANNPSTPFVTPISQSNDRIDTNAPPTLAPLDTVPTLIDTDDADDFPAIFGQLQGHDPEGATLTYGYSGTYTTGTYTVEGDPNAVVYDIASIDFGGAVYLNSVTGQYAYVFDSDVLNSLPVVPLEVTSEFTVTDGNRTVAQELVLTFQGANDRPVLSTDERYLVAIDQDITDGQNSGTTVTALLASAGTVTDAENDNPLQGDAVPVGIAVTSADTSNGLWQYQLSGESTWTNVPVVSSTSALLLAGADLIRFVPDDGYAGEVSYGITFKAWDLDHGVHGTLADTSTNATFSADEAAASVRVDAVPTLDVTPGGGNVEVGDTTATDLFSQVVASTVESDQRFTAMDLTVTGAVDAGEQLHIVGTLVDLANGETAVLPGFGALGGNANVSVVTTLDGLRIQITGLWAADNQMSTLIDSLAYQHTGSTPTLGDRVITVTSLTDNGGSHGHATLSQVSATVTIEDTTPPAQPEVTSATLTNDDTPTITGTAEAGSTIKVTLGTAVYVTTATDGNWSVDLSQPPSTGTLNLNANGSNSFSIVATDASDNDSTPTEHTLVVDTTAPAQPQFNSGTLTSESRPSISGTAESGAQITLTVGTATYVTTATGGTWLVDLSLQPTTGTLNLDENGANTISVVARDGAGNDSDPAEQTLVIDTTDPAVPLFTSADLAGGVEPIITGTAELGSTITLVVGDATYVTTATDGTWSVDLALAPDSGALQLDDNGENLISVTATDAAGNVSEPGTQTLTIDTTDPQAPVFTSGELAGGIEPIITGTAEAGSTITLTVGGATYITTATDGIWSIDLALPPNDGVLQLDDNGENLVSVIATDAAGNDSEPGTQTLTIDTTAPDAPTGVLLPQGGATNVTDVVIDLDALEDGATWQFSLDGGDTWVDGEGDRFTLDDGVYAAGQIQVRQIDAAGNEGAVLQTEAEVTIDTAVPGNPTVSSAALANTAGHTLRGTAEAGSTVTVTLGEAVYRVLATDGTWSVTLGSTPLVSGTLALNANGSNVFAVTATDPAGNTSAPTSHTLVIDTFPPGAPTVSFAAGTSSWVATVGGLEGGAQWQYRVGDGEWTAGQGSSFTLPLQAIAAGLIEVRQIDAAGNPSTSARNEAALTPPVNDTDSDGDGLPDNVEQGVPGMEGGAQGDGNGDGIPDIEQSDVTSLIWQQTPDGQPRYVTLTNSAGLTQESVRTTALEIDTLPAALTLPLGALAFTVRDLPDDGIVNFSIFVDADIPVNGYWKEIDGQWINLATAITSVGGKTRIDFSIEDGGAFDADGERNGVIVDPGAPGWFEGDPFDTDGDQVPDRLEPGFGLTVGTKDNDVFTRDDLFVSQVYRDAFGREAEAGGLAYWEQQLASGAQDHAAVVLSILGNAEAEAVDVLARLSFGLADEAPAAADLAAWRTALSEGGTLESLTDAWIVTAYGNVTNEVFVDQLYQDALGREADAGGRAHWVSQLGQGESRADVALAVLHSAEFDAAHGDDVAVTGVYTALLGRSPDAGGLAYWSAELADGASLEGVVVSILGSTEYHDRFLPADTL